MYVLPDDDGRDFFKCECGWGTNSKYAAAKHYKAPCEEPRTWTGPAAEDAPDEAERLADDLLEAVEAVRRQGRAEGLTEALELTRETVRRSGPRTNHQTLVRLRQRLEKLAEDAGADTSW
jgi:hypothetical protein